RTQKIPNFHRSASVTDTPFSFLFCSCNVPTVSSLFRPEYLLGGIHGQSCRSPGGCRRPCHRARRRSRRRPGPPAERAPPVRLLRALAVMVALVLRSVGRARDPAAGPVRSAALPVPGAPPVGPIRARLP